MTPEQFKRVIESLNRMEAHFDEQSRALALILEQLTPEGRTAHP
jgi:hypothetical protein